MRASRDDLRALFTDVRIPGVALAQRVRRATGVEIVVTSGSGRVDPVALPADARFLPKPYTAFQVTRAQGALAARRWRRSRDSDAR